MEKTGVSFLENRLIVMQGDITAVKADVIVNAANSSLLGGGGVDGMIHQRGGGAILRECRALRETQFKDGLPTGEAAVTTAGMLPASFVIHTVGPVWHGGNAHEEQLLTKAYTNSLLAAQGVGAKSVAFPAISTGIYGYPKEMGAAVACRTIADFLAHSEIPAVVYYVLYSLQDFNIFHDAARRVIKK